MNTPSQAPNLAISRREVLLRAIEDARSALHNAENEVSATTTDRQLSTASSSVLPAVTQSLDQVQGLLSVLADGDDANFTDGISTLVQLTKKRKLENGGAAGAAVVSPATEQKRAVVGGKTLRHLHRLQLSNAVHVSPMDTLGIDVLIIILSFLEWESIMLARVCRRLKEASLLTPVGDVMVSKCLGQCLEGNLSKLATALPGIQSFDFENDTIIRNGRCRFLEGPLALRNFDVELSGLSGFRSLKVLDLFQMKLNGSYPEVFKITSLEELDLRGNPYFLCHLAEFASLPNLARVFLDGERVTGRLSSLDHLRDKLECLELIECEEVVGSLTDLFSFTKLKILNLSYSSQISGDIRTIEASDFVSLQSLRICHTNIFGGVVPRIAEGRVVAMAWRRLLLQRGVFFSCNALADGIDLSASSGENYFFGPDYIRHNMKLIRFDEQTLGFQWAETSPDENVPGGLNTCSINWLEPCPTESDENFFRYASFLAFRNSHDVLHRKCSMFHHLPVPPTDEESRRSLMERFLFDGEDENESDDASMGHVEI